MLLFIFSLLPFILYSKNSIIDPFLLQHVSNLILNRDVGNVDFVGANLIYIKGFGVMLLILEKITGINLQTLQFCVIVGPIFLISYYTLSREFTRSNIHSLLLMTTLAFGFATSYYSVWPHGWGFTLYIIFVYLYLKLISNSVLIIKARYIILLLIVFAATNFYSYTAEVWMIIFSIIVNFLILLYSHAYNKNLKNYLTQNILIVFITLFLIFNDIAFNSYLPKIKFNAIYDSALSFLHPFFSFLGSVVTEQYKYAYHPESPKLLVLINALILVLLVLPVLVSIFFDIKNLLNKDFNVDFVKTSIIKYPLVVVGLADTIIYSLVGVFFLRYILFMFPILAVASVTRFEAKSKQRFITLFVCCILLLSIFSFCWNWSLDLKNTSKSQYKEFNYGANWIYNNGINTQILSDHYTVSLYQITFAEMGDKLDGRYYSEEDFYHLVDPNFLERNDGYFKNYYVIINQEFKNKKTWAGGWNDFTPIVIHEHNIERNINLNKIYDDRITSIFRSS